MTDLVHAVPAGDVHDASPRDLQAFRADLEKHRRFRVEQLRNLAGDAEAGSDKALDQVTSALRTAAAAVLADIDAALRRIELGDFGRCQRCHHPIPLDRLTALPMAGLCMTCQYAQEVAGPRREPAPLDVVEEWGRGSFPASDPPSNW